MTIEMLRRLADDFCSVPLSDFDTLAEGCRDLAINRLDLRFVVVGECLRLSAEMPGTGETGAVSADFARALGRAWAAYLPGVLVEPSEAAATALALALRDELTVLAGHDPVAYESPPDLAG